MHKSLISSMVLCLTVTSLLMTETAHARFKCWTNKEGIKECGETVPPEYAQDGHQEIGTGGIVREETERAKTDEEIAEEKRLAEIEAEKQKALEAQKQRDTILLQTFTSVSDIERARDERVDALDASIKLTQQRNEKIQVDLDKRIEAAAADERAGKQPSEELLKDIDSLTRQIKNNDQFVADKHAEQDEIRQTHADDINRFKELKGIE